MTGEDDTKLTLQRDPKADMRCQRQTITAMTAGAGGRPEPDGPPPFGQM